MRKRNIKNPNYYDLSVWEVIELYLGFAGIEVFQRFRRGGCSYLLNTTYLKYISG
jgi:hypothetical protein